ncbi:MAG: cupin domain-containing protein [Actinomycetes bacterium]
MNPLQSFPVVALEPDSDGTRNACRDIIVPPGTAWDGFALMEWELEKAGWQDLHPHDETTYMLEGELEIESEGVTVILRPGDAVTVRGGHLGRYVARNYARMLAIYGPNPTGAESSSFSSWRVE